MDLLLPLEALVARRTWCWVAGCQPSFARMLEDVADSGLGVPKAGVVSLPCLRVATRMPAQAPDRPATEAVAAFWLLTLA